jgi:hypothetical protein
MKIPKKYLTKNPGVIEWLKYSLEEYGDPNELVITWDDFDELISHAEAMHKKQTVDFAEKAIRIALCEDIQNPFNLDELYNEAYGGNNEQQ